MKKIILWVIILVAVCVVSYYFFIPTSIVINNESEIKTPNLIAAKKLVEKVKKEKTKDNPSVVLNCQIEYKIAKCDNFDYKKAKERLSNEINVEVPCTVILVNNKPLVGLPTKDEAGAFMLAIKDKFSLPNCEEPEIKENVTIDNSSCSIDLYCESAEDAVKKIFDPKSREVEKDIVYTVKKGDTLSGIGVKYKVPVSELKALNPNVKSLRVGSKIRVKGKVLKPVGITVVTRKNNNGIVIIPPPVVKVSSVKIPFGKQKVIFPGKAGKKRVEGWTVFENGEKVREENTFEEILVQPVAKQIAVGI